jgi:hypothetical protein
MQQIHVYYRKYYIHFHRYDFVQIQHICNTVSATKVVHNWASWHMYTEYANAFRISYQCIAGKVHKFDI